MLFKDMTLLITLFITFLSLTTSFASNNHVKSSNTALQMGLFDGLFKSSKQASCLHILVDGPKANEQLVDMKFDIYKKAVGLFGDVSEGVDPEKLVSAFSQKAKAKSICPSKKDGGNLGTFGEGEMAPAFDTVAFKEQIGVIHGPVETEFGSHLILITNRE